MNFKKSEVFSNIDVKAHQIHERLMELVDEDENIAKFSEKLEQFIDDWDKKNRRI